jgi:hypothetical protein
MAVLFGLNLIYAIFLIVKKKNISIWYSFISLFVHIIFLYQYANDVNTLLPFNIPRWLVNDDLLIYVGTFFMPILAYAIFSIVVYFTPQHRIQNKWKDFVYLISVPILAYIFNTGIFPFWKISIINYEYKRLFIDILLISASLLFIFLFIRIIYSYLFHKKFWNNPNSIYWKIIIAIILPLIGLYINKVSPSPSTFDTQDVNIFGNFIHPIFYILAIINGILFCLPNTKNLTLNLLIFIGRSITFSYIFYFFLVFLPFLPLSLIAVIAFGLGFLMLTPLVLFMLQIKQLYLDFKNLKNEYSPILLKMVIFVGFLIIPSIITAKYLSDRSNIHQALEYVYSPNYKKKYKIDEESLFNSLEIIKHHKDRSFRIIDNKKTPYLSSFFNWLVLDNLVLSDKKINDFENIFFGKINNTQRRRWRGQRNVTVSNIDVESSYNKKDKVWKTWLNLELTNLDSNNRFSEYSTQFNLPEGCWISDYYLYVGERKEMGILAEKKTAMWVFSNIRNTNRDPGILYYQTGNNIGFKVFPFNDLETRKTGIEFIHKEPFELEFDDQKIFIGDSNSVNSEIVETENLIYIPSVEKKNFEPIRREPEYYFLVDCSKDQDSNYTKYKNQISQFIDRKGINKEDYHIYYLNSGLNKGDNPVSFNGGFFLDRGIKTILTESFNKNRKPIIISVTDSFQKAIFINNFADLSFTFPDINYFFNLDSKGEINSHSLLKNPKKTREITIDEALKAESLLYRSAPGKTHYLPNNNQGSIVLKKDYFTQETSELENKKWLSALKMHGKWMNLILHPEKSTKDWLTLVRSSFQAQIMNPYTSFLVVENEAQKAMLFKKQKQVLSGNKDLDLDEDSQNMSEPNIYILIVLFLGNLWFRSRRKEQYSIQ